MTVPSPTATPHQMGTESSFVRRLFYALIVLALVLSILPVAARFLQGPPSPEALQFFPSDQVERARYLARINIIPGILAGLAPLGALLWLCFARSGQRLLHWLEGPPVRRLWISALGVTAGAIILSSVVALPFELILFQISSAHGLTVQPPGRWLGNWGTRLMLDVILVALTALPAYALIRRWPRTWWVGGAAVAVTVVLLKSMLYPTLIAPLFDHSSPIKDPQVLAMVDRLASQVGVQVGEVRMLNASARTTTANAQVQGFGPTRRVVIWDTTLEQFSPDELEVVLAHELGHVAYGDVATLAISQGVVIGLVVCLIALILRCMAAAGSAGLREPFGPRVIGVALLLVALLGVITEPTLNTLSRTIEARADRFALQQTQKPEAFIGSLTKIYAMNRADPEPPAIGEFLRLNHPSPMTRLRLGLEFSKP